MSRSRARFTRFGVLSVLTLAASTAAGQEPIRWSLKAGDALTYEFGQTSSLKTVEDGRENATRSVLKVDLTWKVDSIKGDGSIDLTQTVDRCVATITENGMSYAYDSKDKGKEPENPVTQMLGKVYDAVVGQGYKLTLSPRGEVISVEVPKAVTEATANSPFAAMADSGSFLSTAGIKNMFGQILPRFPVEAIAPGSTWVAEMTLPSGPLSMLLKTTYRLDKGPPEASINSSVVVTIKNPPKAEFSLDVLKQDGTGTFAFDQASGRLRDGSVRQSMQMTVKFGDRAVGQTIETGQTLRLLK